jgi:chromosome segregation ATPase
MQHKRIAISIFSAAAFAVTIGCKGESKTASTANNDPALDASARLDQLKQDTQQAADSLRDYSYAQKTEYANKLRAELAAMNKELDTLAVRIEGSTASAKGEAKAKLEDVRNRVARLNTRLDELTRATESTWNDVKNGVKSGFDDLKESFTALKEWVGDKISR